MEFDTEYWLSRAYAVAAMIVTLCLPAYAAQAQPLVTFEQQIENLRYDCRFVDDPECVTRLNDIKDRQKKYTRFCRVNPRDPQCGALYRDADDHAKQIAELCEKNPEHPNCSQLKKKKKEIETKRRWNCRLNPLSHGCHSDDLPAKRGEKKKDMKKFCEENPKSDHCRDYYEIMRQRQKRELDKIEDLGQF